MLLTDSFDERSSLRTKSSSRVSFRRSARSGDGVSPSATQPGHVNAPAGSLLANAQLNNAAAGAGQPQADAITDAVQQASQQHAQHVNAGWDKLRAFVHEHQTKTDNQLKSIVEQLIQLKAGIDSAQ
jgi:hypothetical protein